LLRSLLFVLWIGWVVFAVVGCSPVVAVGCSFGSADSFIILYILVVFCYLFI